MSAADDAREIKACLAKRVSDYKPHVLGMDACLKPNAHLVGMGSSDPFNRDPETPATSRRSA